MFQISETRTNSRTSIRKWEFDMASAVVLSEKFSFQRIKMLNFDYWQTYFQEIGMVFSQSTRFE